MVATAPAAATQSVSRPVSRLAQSIRQTYIDMVVDDLGPRRWMRARIGSMFFIFALIWPVKHTLRGDLPVPYKVIILAGLIAYAACFIIVIWRNTPLLHANRAPYAVIASLAIGGGLAVVFGEQWLSVMTYTTVAMLLLNCRTGRWPYIVLGIPLAEILISWWGFGDHSTHPFSVALQGLLIGAIQAAFYLQIAAKLELRRARADLARLAVSEERLRISRDLHDILGQQLSALSLKAELAARLASRDADRAAAEMIEVAAVARAALADVRETVAGYRTMSLCGEVETARALLTAARVETTITIVELPPALDICGAWVIREAVTNVIRHAGATQCEISAARTSGSVVIEVRDNGGTASSVLMFGNGLTGLAERVESEHGVLTTDREQGWFVVRATFALGGGA